MRKWTKGTWTLVILLALSAGAGLSWWWTAQTSRTTAWIVRLLGVAISSGVVAVIGLIRNERVRWLQVQERRMSNTNMIIDDYLQHMRQRLITFLQTFVEEFGEDDTKDPVEQLDAMIAFAEAHDFAGILHQLDKLGMQLVVPGYVFEQLLLPAIASEVARLLMDNRIAMLLREYMKDSTLQHVFLLQERVLEEVTRRGRSNR